MRKIYSFVLAFVACILATNINAAISITINIDDINRVKVLRDYQEVSGLVTGNNVISLENEYTYVEIHPKSSDFGLTSVVLIDKEGKTEDCYISYGVCAFQVSSYHDGFTYKVTSFSCAALRTASCKIYVDNASKVTVKRNNYSDIALTDGLNIVKFIADGDNAETPFSISSNSSLYKVKLNGEEKSGSSGYYSVAPVDGDSITILANYPDIDVPVHFIAGNEASKGFITEVTVDGEAVTNWADDNFTVKLGSTVGYKGNQSDYKFDSLFVGTTKSTYLSSSGATFFVGSTTEDYTVKYYAHKYATYDITINIDHPERVTLYKGYSYSNNPISLVAGKNTVSLTEQVTGISFKVNAGCWIESFVDAEGNEYKNTSSYSLINTSAGKVFTITTGEVDRQLHAEFYIDDPSASPHGGNVTFAADGSNRSTPLIFQGGGGVLAQSGYNLLTFDASFDNPVQVSFWGPDASTIFFYINDVKQDASTSFNFTLADGDVIKAFLKAEPKTYTVTFAAKEGTGYGFADVVRDVIVPVKDVTAPLSVLTDTKISFKLTGTTQVTANDKVLVAGDEGVYSLSINENTTILAGGETTAVENAGAAQNNNVYTLQGVLLLKDATEAEVKALPAGMYIINGKTSYLLQH